MLKAGEAAPEFEAVDQYGENHRLSDYRGKWVLLYFYPEDDTPGCTKEAKAFRDRLGKFTDQGIVVMGVSGDDVTSHTRFAARYGLRFPLLADPGKNILPQYEALGPIGRARRVSYLINEAGVIAKVYQKVKPDEHADQILKDFESGQQPVTAS